ncbi:MAG: hypothetical protein M3P10_07570 [Actinomycetota bacterium]|nr:hypothetical protein [Actinomycetota bacterium]
MNAGSPAATLELSIPADPALALTARMFAGAVSRHLTADVSPDDLKLAFSELLAAAIDAGAAEVVFRVDLERQEVTVHGAGGSTATGEGLEDHDRFARSHRADLLAALFPGILIDVDTVTMPLRVAAE